MTGLQIRNLRKQLKLSQAGLAKELGVTFTTVNRWENGRTQPQPGHLERIRLLRTSKTKVPRFGTLSQKVRPIEDKYLLEEPEDVLRELYGDELIELPKPSAAGYPHPDLVSDTHLIVFRARLST